MNGRTAARRLAVATAAASAFLCLAGPAGAAVPAATGLTGIWLLDQHTFDNQQAFKPPFRPEVQKAVDDEAKAAREGGKVIEDNARLCLPIGMPFMIANEFALKFIESPGEVTVISEASSLVRTIYLNKKTHPTDQDPSWNGHSIGHWEGRTLVIDTVNLNDRTSHLPRVRGVVSLTTHITERYHIEDGGKTLVNDATFEDPKILSRSWTVTYRYHPAEAGSELWEYVCEVNAAGWSERFKGDPAFNAGASKPAS
jgi:hypothetical protein